MADGDAVTELQPRPDIEDLASLLKGLANIDRLQIIRLMSDGRERSPTMLADFLAPAPLGRISYHVRCMVERELLTLVRTEPRRGALEHFYVISDEGKRMKKWLRL